MSPQIHSLIKFDNTFDPKIRNKSQLKKMPEIEEFFTSSKHCRMREYSVEFRFCQENDCSICARMGRTARSPSIEVDVYNFQNEILHWMDLSIIEQNNNNHFMSPKLGRQYTDSKNPSIENLLKALPKSKEGTKEKQAIVNAKKKNKNFI